MGAGIDIASVVERLHSFGPKTEWIVFATDNADPETIGQGISALANSARRCNVPVAYMVWGVDDETHEVVGSPFCHRLEGGEARSSRRGFTGGSRTTPPLSSSRLRSTAST